MIQIINIKCSECENNEATQQDNGDGTFNNYCDACGYREDETGVIPRDADWVKSMISAIKARFETVANKTIETYKLSGMELAQCGCGKSYPSEWILEGDLCPFCGEKLTSPFYDSMYPMFKECHPDHVVLVAEDMWEKLEEHTITIEDIKNYGNSGSGMSCLGSVMGDHRVIMQIYEDVLDYFQREHPEHFTDKEDKNDGTSDSNNT